MLDDVSACDSSSAHLSQTLSQMPATCSWRRRCERIHRLGQSDDLLDELGLSEPPIDQSFSESVSRFDTQFWGFKRKAKATAAPSSVESNSIGQVQGASRRDCSKLCALRVVPNGVGSPPTTFSSRRALRFQKQLQVQRWLVSFLGDPPKKMGFLLVFLSSQPKQGSPTEPCATCVSIRPICQATLEATLEARAVFRSGKRKPLGARGFQAQKLIAVSLLL